MLRSLSGVTACRQGTLELTEGNLSRYLQVLEEAGLAKITKEFRGRRPRTWASMTTRGRAALAVELEALRALVDPAASKKALTS